MRNCKLLMMVAIALLLSASALADVPKLMNLQSILRDGTGNPVADGAYLVKFIIWDDPVASGTGNQKWSSGFQAINTLDGLLQYHLGSNTALPNDLFAGSDTALFLGITVGVDPEMSPRIKLTSVAFSQHALRSDSSSEASSLGGQVPSYYLDWNNLSNVPAGFADGIDDDTNMGASAPLQINAGNVEVIADGIDASHIATGGIGSDEVLDNSLTAIDLGTNSVFADEIAAGAVGTSEIATGSIINSDVSNAAGIDVTKISGTAVNLSSTQTITGDKRFGDSTMRISGTGVRVGDGGGPVPSVLVYTERQYNETSSRYGHATDLDNSATGTLYGYQALIGSPSDAGGERYGFMARVDNGDAATETQYALTGGAGRSTKTAGISYGVYATAAAGVGATARAVYGGASGGGTLHAGYFVGHVNITGFLSKGGGAFKIDHPLDPENQYLMHSFVESPDMMNVYNGNAQLDGLGRAIVQLPDYFEALNREFRYQLTSIGSSQPDLYVEQEVLDNRFMIAGGQANGRVSWQVTGVRKDPWAQANRIQVEVEKTGTERGKYVHYKEYGVALTQAVDGVELQRALDEEKAQHPPIE